MIFREPVEFLVKNRKYPDTSGFFQILKPQNGPEFKIKF